MTYLTLAESLVKTLEGCKLTGYLDSVGKPTIGYGHTGPEVRVGVAVTQEIADHDLLVDLATADARLSAVAPEVSALLDHKRAALVSFVFNVGANPDWTIWKDIPDNLADVPTQLRRFVNGRIKGEEQVIPGLKSRREAEIAFWNTADVAQAAAVIAATPVAAPPSSTTRDIPTPPTLEPPKPMAKSSLVTKLVTGVAGAGAAASQLHDIALPHASESPIFAHIAVGCSLVVVAAAAVALIIHSHQEEARHV